MIDTDTDITGFATMPSIKIQVCYHKGPLSQKSTGHMQNRKTKTNPSPDPNRYRRRCPDPNARIQKFRRYMALMIRKQANELS